MLYAIFYGKCNIIERHYILRPIVFYFFQIAIFARNENRRFSTTTLADQHLNQAITQITKRVEARALATAQYEWHGVRERAYSQLFTVPIRLRRREPSASIGTDKVRLAVTKILSCTKKKIIRSSV